ncbi:hypothetical protein [Thermaurantiacus tibetensis]|uniref:hypothetical protein n=1 Tax=Thermaurantiacus tibetensis TaxID=2759035 RepID=UPI00188EC581|nr:hypothetical protein [Thermaurantiacus tibetensis]
MPGPVSLPPPGAAAAAEPLPRSAREAMLGFEALVVQHMLRAARPEALRADGLAGALAGGAGDWQDLVDRHLARLIAAGQPFGLARELGATLAANAPEAGRE